MLGRSRVKFRYFPWVYLGIPGYTQVYLWKYLEVYQVYQLSHFRHFDISFAVPPVSRF
jgi:hypothetical protein